MCEKDFIFLAVKKNSLNNIKLIIYLAFDFQKNLKTVKI